MIKRVYLGFTILLILLYSYCTKQDENVRFEALANHYIEGFLQRNPLWATQLGDHRYDSVFGDYSIEAAEELKNYSQLYLDSLNAIDQGKLSLTNRIDRMILQNSLEYTIFEFDTLKEYEWNPLLYNTGQGIYGLLARDFAPLKQRLMSVNARLKGIPAVIEQAKLNLKNPPKIHTETAILQNKGNIGLIFGELDAFIENVPELKDTIIPNQKRATEALKDYGKWLEETLLPRSSGDFRLGNEKFRKKLYYTLQSDLTKEDILDRAMKDLKTTQDQMFETALKLYKGSDTGNKKEVIKSVLNDLADEHPTNENIVERAKGALKSTTDFVRSQQLVTVPDKPLEIIVMPEFERGVAVAYCDAPGPLEKEGKTLFSISPTPDNWTDARVRSFFREYNNYMLQDLCIHEAMPGHYLQLAHSNKFQAPTMIRAIFASGTFIEGWATYAEQLMVEQGYGGPQVKMQQLKMRLRLIINAIIDQKIHTAGMTEKEAMALMTEEGFQEEGEAAGKWRRACLTSTQLSTYYVGNSELNDLRTAYESKYGKNVDLKTMHDAILAYGSPAAKFVKMHLGL